MTTLHNIFVYITDIVGECGKEQTVTPELAEYGAELTQVFPQECVRLSFRHGACRIAFARLHTVTPAHVWVVFLRVPALKVAGTQKCSFHKRQAVNCRLPVRFLLAADLCGHRTDRHK